MRFSLPRALRQACGAAAALAATAALAQAPAYPNAPITLIVPFAAGSGTDAVARTVGQKLAERLKQPVLVDNKPGANAQVGAQLAARARPDGYTLFMTTNTSHSANPALYTSLKYDPIKDFTPVARVGELPFALVVSPALPVKTLAEFLDYARAHPGTLSYATPNSTSLVAMESIKHIAKVDILGVPYKSSPQALTDLLGGQVQAYVVDLGSGKTMLTGDKVRTLGITTAQPSPLLPGVPPIGQTVKGFDLTSWNGLFGPAGMPPAVVQRLNTELQAVLADKDTQDKLAQIGFQVWPSRTPEEFAQYVAQQLAHWRTLIQQAGIQATSP
ncbi:tripartite tricarboxylate transporter substrate binding protein [Acidovorax sp. NCPPB 3859]|nr:MULTISPECIES: tripartite tricarboxylate transporter substrate binding protein [unclassified Acidovorax]MDA8450012.1 tripartite tricarboxylate transporter substrate binding protein [Acidovorax sp. GBBC 3297]MDA8459457.1 tripartite tricarboxylate transporter substrate binding protein [Acidovorax sp. GBBC 3333]MDA8464494.1 tripartite tricarboxylate transporter substrate binding protein [Acidovorax sp. GBBC 3332]MDA8469295.1 tripartite tricarboxylate transporter substrate binding protein [Acidov